MTDAPSPDLIKLIMELRGQGVTDARVLDALERVPRAAFVSEAQRSQAYENKPLPIGLGQTISQPFIVGLMTHALKLGERMKVLEIGTGSGYQAAVLAKLSLRVYTMERHRDLMREAELRFKKLGLSNIVTAHGDGYLGWPEQAPFDRIIVTAAAPELPDRLIDQLKIGGILVCPVGPAGATQVLLRVTKQDAGKEVENLGFVAFVPMLQGVARDG
ncbi:Protein-L-isoaspartate O-methyltransferase [Alphaproteobacteria bacterium SO-S41]|nr:Protein-L-isoaspartate O-methyltransferase [Alphaproteobacteria bacterium SO-S41]